MKKLIALDLDGTLLDENSIVPESTKEYLRKLKEKGNIITIASGRTVQSAIDVTDGAEFVNYIISDTGAIIFNREYNKIEDARYINKNEAYKMFGDIQNDENVLFRIFNEDSKLYEYRKGEINTIPNDFWSKKENILHIAMHSRSGIDEFFDENHNKYESTRMFVMKDSFSDYRWLEILEKEVDKWNAVNNLANILGIKNEDIICFGDASNDLEMIKNAGVGVAMYNADGVVKSIAKCVTDSNKYKGVEMWLRKNLTF